MCDSRERSISFYLNTCANWSLHGIVPADIVEELSGPLVFLKLTNQTLAARLAAFHADAALHVFPAGFCEKATEVLSAGAQVVRHRKGRQLLRLDGVAATPDAFSAWQSSPPLRGRCTRTFFFDANPPAAASLGGLVTALARQGAPDGAVRLQCDPPAIEQHLIQHLPAEFELDPRSFQYVLYVLELDDESQVRYLYQMVPALKFWRMATISPPSHGSCSRAFLKIEEAFAALNLGAQLACGAVAIDLGAAPGGWTSFTVQQGCHVLAVDPADLDAAVEAHPSVTHIRRKSQLADASIQEQLQLHGGSAQLLLSDMNVHPTQMALALRPLLQHVQPGGWIIVTLKLRGCGRDRSRWLEELPRLLSCRFRTARLLWLCANTEYETTFCGQLDAVEHAGQ